MLDSAVVGIFGALFIQSTDIAQYLLLFRPCSDHRDTVRNKKDKAGHSQSYHLGEEQGARSSTRNSHVIQVSPSVPATLRGHR